MIQQPQTQTRKASGLAGLMGHSSSVYIESLQLQTPEISHFVNNRLCQPANLNKREQSNNWVYRILYVIKSQRGDRLATRSRHSPR